MLLLGALLLGQWYCPQEGCALTPQKRALVRLKNRETLPQAADFDERATLSALLQPGDDAGRWSSARAATLEGYVVAVGDGAIEAANCFSVHRRDTHIDLALDPHAPPTERVVLEVTARLRERAKARGQDWSTDALRRELPGHWCRFQGWLLFDTEHADEAENTNPSGRNNWRATGWELHPLTDIKVIK